MTIRIHKIDKHEKVILYDYTSCNEEEGKVIYNPVVELWDDREESRCRAKNKRINKNARKGW